MLTKKKSDSFFFSNFADLAHNKLKFIKFEKFSNWKIVFTVSENPSKSLILQITTLRATFILELKLFEFWCQNHYQDICRCKFWRGNSNETCLTIFMWYWKITVIGNLLKNDKLVVIEICCVKIQCWLGIFTSNVVTVWQWSLFSHTRYV